MADETSRRLLDAREDPLGDKAHALPGVSFGETVAEIIVEPAQDFVAAIDERGLRSKVREDAGELDGDVAPAGDDDRLGQTLEMKRLVRGDDVLDAGERLSEHRRPPGGDENFSRGYGPS